METDQQPSTSASSSSVSLANASQIKTNYVNNLSNQEKRQLLQPIRCGLIDESTILHLNVRNQSVDQQFITIAAVELIQLLGDRWTKWVRGGADSSCIIETKLAFQEIDEEQSMEIVRDTFENLSAKQLRCLLNSVNNGLFSDETCLSIFRTNGPDRIEVSMKKVVEILKNQEEKQWQKNKFEHSILYRFITMVFFSSVNLEKAERSDLNIRGLESLRHRLSLINIFIFSVSTLLTFGAHIWATVVNYEQMLEQLTPAGYVVALCLSSALIGTLLYLTIYMIAFIFCCEHSMHRLVTTDRHRRRRTSSILRRHSSVAVAVISANVYTRSNSISSAHHRLSNAAAVIEFNRNSSSSRFYRHFSELHNFRQRNISLNVVQLILLMYTFFLVVYARDNNLNIYPALCGLIAHGTGLALFPRIASFIRKCRTNRELGRDDVLLAQ